MTEAAVMHLSARHASAETAAAAALALAQSWAGWSALHAMATATAADTPEAAAALLPALAELVRDRHALTQALDAWEIMDLAARAWSRHAHGQPVGRLAPPPRVDPPEIPAHQ